MANQISFEQWKHAVDTAMTCIIGLSSDDLPDWDYYSAYDDGLSPTLAANRAINAAGDC